MPTREPGSAPQSRTSPAPGLCRCDVVDLRAAPRPAARDAQGEEEGAEGQVGGGAGARRRDVRRRGAHRLEEGGGGGQGRGGEAGGRRRGGQEAAGEVRRVRPLGVGHHGVQGDVQPRGLGRRRRHRARRGDRADADGGLRVHGAGGGRHDRGDRPRRQRRRRLRRCAAPSPWWPSCSNSPLFMRNCAHAGALPLVALVLRFPLLHAQLCSRGRAVGAQSS